MKSKKYILIALGLGLIGWGVYDMKAPTKEEKLAYLKENCLTEFKSKANNPEGEIVEMCDCVVKVYEAQLPDYFIDEIYQAKKTNDTIKMGDLNRKMFATPAVSRAFEKSCKSYARTLIIK